MKTQHKIFPSLPITLPKTTSNQAISEMTVVAIPYLLFLHLKLWKKTSKITEISTIFFQGEYMDTPVIDDVLFIFTKSEK